MARQKAPETFDEKLAQLNELREEAIHLARVEELDAELVLLCLSGRGDKDLGRG